MISGKTRDQCLLALRAAQGNPDVAFEILLSGGVPVGEGGGSEEFGDDYGDESEDPMAGNPLAAIAQNPNFQLIRQRILQDPAFYN